ncbi:protein TALPID3 isoform X4 [Kryptolebias marmoratus]|uniref:protein TALPID3 isoform X4 n=1 Tax=Kryptolebias marmoratus TaxID=37003 RepID=UPI0007F9182D|nr:protein TALPID3 isoform X4 [Kryptolebias marmoratus]
MLYNPDRSPDRSPDLSSCSSDTGKVLIRSTRVLVPDRGDESQPVQITVRRLLDTPHLHRTEQNLTRHVGAGPKPGDSDPDQGAASSRSDQELLTSCFTTGQRGAVLEALRQRCHSAPRRREVSVQLLEPRMPQNPLTGQGPDSVAAVLTEPDRSSGHLGDTSNMAAVAAATAVAAPLIKAQSDIEARMSQLAEGVQRLLHTNREPEGRSLSQQTLQQLETLQRQQLQLQSQLLESAIRIVTGHASRTSDPRTAENTWSSSGDAAVTMETRSAHLTPQLTRDPRCLQDVLLTEGTPLRSLANQSQEAVRRANEMLREMKSLKAEIKMLLTQPEDSGYFPGPAPEPLQSHQNQVNQPSSDRNQNHQHHPQRDDHLQFQPSQSQHPESHQNQSQHKPSHQNQSNHPESQQNQSKHPESHQNQSKHPESQQNQSKHLDSHQNTLQHKQSHHIRSQPLQSLQNRYHLLESHQNQLQHAQSHLNQAEDQNLQSNQTASNQQNIFPASHIPFHEIPSPEHQSHQVQSGLVQRRPVHLSMLEEAGQVLRQARRRKKVLEDNLEALLKAKNGEILHCQLEALAANRDLDEEVRIKKTVDSWINTLTREIQARDPPSPPPHAAAPQVRPAGGGKPGSTLRPTGSKAAVRSRGQRAEHQAEAEPSRLTGKLTDSRQQQEDDRETYLTRLYGKLPHEGLRRTLKRSPYPRFSSPASPLSRKPRPRLVESIKGVTMKSCKTQTSLAPSLTRSHPSSHDPADSFPVAMAIPLGRPRMDSSRRERPQEVTSVLPVPFSQTVENMDEDAPEDQQQPEAEETPSNIVDILEADSQRDKEETVLPGAACQFVSDVLQQELSDVGEEAVVLDGGPSPAPVLYQGPVFPPGAVSSLSDHEPVPVLGGSQQQQVLENRLVEWVEQQLMSRMISQIYQPPLSDPAYNQHPDQSELEERSEASDIVEAAGGAGLQLFVDSNLSVDSELIRRLVNEVLTETVAQILGQRNASNAGLEPGLEAPEPGPGPNEEVLLQQNLVPVVLTPVPTPLPSVTQNSRESTPVTTPPPSEPSTSLSPQPPDPEPIRAPEPVTTPASTPEPQITEGTPPLAHQATPPLTWGDAELPLEEERPEEHLDPDKQQLIMSVAEEEPPVCSPLPPPPPKSDGPEPGPPSSSSEDLSSSSPSSSTVTAETEAALKHISEGELLISVSQLPPPTEDEAVCSFSSSLQELQEMDFDPPAYEEVRGRNLLLTLLTKMDQGVTYRGERRQPEGSWGREEEEVSVGEVREYEATGPVRRLSQAAGQEEEEKQGGRMKMDVFLPPIRPQEQQEAEPPGAAAETDSSTSDVF